VRPLPSTNTLTLSLSLFADSLGLTKALTPLVINEHAVILQKHIIVDASLTQYEQMKKSYPQILQAVHPDTKDTALHLILRQNQAKIGPILTFMLRHFEDQWLAKNSAGLTPLDQASILVYPTALRIVVDHLKANPNTPLFSNWETMLFRVDNKQKVDPIEVSIQMGAIDILEFLLRLPASNFTPQKANHSAYE